MIQNVINQSWVDSNINNKANQSFFEWAIEYAATTSGVRRLLSLIGTGAELRNELGASPSFLATQFSDATQKASPVLKLIGLPSATKEAYDALANLDQTDALGRRAIEALKSAMGALRSWSGAIIFMSANFALKRVVQIADFGEDVIDLGLSIADYRQASSLEDVASGKIKEAYCHTRKYYMLRIARAVVSIATVALASFMLITGWGVLPMTVSLCLTLGSVSLAIYRDRLKSSGTFHLVT